MNVIGIDPGPETSGVVKIFASSGWLAWMKSGAFGEVPTDGVKMASMNNEATTRDVRTAIAGANDLVAVEWLTSYGTAVGESTFRTALAVGRVLESADAFGVKTELLTRPQCATMLCGTPRVKGDAPMSEACRNLVPQTGGGKKPAVGTKDRPGPLYGLAGPHAWSALHVAMAALVRRCQI